MKPLTPRPFDDSAERAAAISRSVRRVRNLGIVAIAAFAVLVAAAATEVGRSLGGSLAWAVLGAAAGIALAVVWGLFITKVWCSTLRRMGDDYRATVVPTRKPPG